MDNNLESSKPVSMMSIECESLESMYETKEMIHKQLVGNQDYADFNIMLCSSDDILDPAEPYKVYLAVFKECKGPVPELRIKLGGN